MESNGVAVDKKGHLPHVFLRASKNWQEASVGGPECVTERMELSVNPG